MTEDQRGTLETGGRCLGRLGSCRRSFLSFTTTIAALAAIAAVAAVAAVATTQAVAQATAVATTKATVAAVACIAPAVANFPAVTTIAGVAAMATMTRDGLLVTAQEGDSDDREEDRDTENQSTIHVLKPPLTHRYRK